MKFDGVEKMCVEELCEKCAYYQKENKKCHNPKGCEPAFIESKQ